MDAPWVRLVVVVALIAVNALFVAMEFSLVAADRVTIEREAATGSRRAGRAAKVLSQLSFHLSGAQLGITVCSLLLGALAEPAAAELLEPLLAPLGGVGRGISVVIALLVVTASQMVLGELVPKAVAIARARETTLRLTPFIAAYGFVLGPLIRLLNASADAAVRRLGIEPKGELSTSRTLDEFRVIIETAADEGELDEEARGLLERSLRFGDKTAATVLVPRNRVTALPVTASLVDLANASLRTGFSRFPVYASGLDDIVGVVHIKQTFGHPFTTRATKLLSEVMDEPLVIPESRDLGSLLAEMGVTGQHLAVVVDEYGGTAGILTAEDVLEEIVGTIDDEHDPRTPRLVERDGDDFLLPGLLHADEVADACGFDLPEGDYETLAGFLLERFDRIPAVGDSCTARSWRFTIEEMEGLRIGTVRVTRPEPTPVLDEGEW